MRLVSMENKSETQIAEIATIACSSKQQCNEYIKLVVRGRP